MDRVTTLGSTLRTNQWIGTSAQSLAKTQEQVATGVRFTAASEAPVDAAVLLRNQRSLDRQEQMGRNHANAQLWLETSDSALNDTVATMTQGRTLAVSGANGTNTDEARAAIAVQLRSISDELISLSNTTLNGRPIFGGTAGTTQAYDLDGNYLGDDGEVVRTVSPSDSFTVSPNGPGVFGTPNPADPFGGSAFEVFDALADAVEAGDTAAVRQGIEAVDTAISRTQGEVGRLGSLASRLDEIAARNESGQISTRAQISDLRDVDMTDAIVRLRAAETSYEATLSAASRSLGPSLLDFLR